MEGVTFVITWSDTPGVRVQQLSSGPGSIKRYNVRPLVKTLTLSSNPSGTKENWTRKLQTQEPQMIEH
ncbi:hypothetical protein PoB_004190800 [Plakobranchus ocellatus]|uniref:Uncharacterized protein n=1 Tax=Plakobranchus ocellatus TaxID=259542 RepID=A0AAV4B9A6_9GAST|nr:hypothetical protein PoB_004190800 [Plakobranchus ocellatus]